MIHDYSAFGPDRVLSGIGAVEGLPAELDDLGASRAMLITGRTLATQTDLVRRVESILGVRHASTFAECGQHVPESSVTAVASQGSRSLSSWIPRATSSLPVPVSPVMSTDACEVATRRIRVLSR